MSCPLFLRVQADPLQAYHARVQDGCFAMHALLPYCSASAACNLNFKFSDKYLTPSGADFHDSKQINCHTHQYRSEWCSCQQ